MTSLEFASWGGNLRKFSLWLHNLTQKFNLFTVLSLFTAVIKSNFFFDKKNIYCSPCVQRILSNLIMKELMTVEKERLRELFSDRIITRTRFITLCISGLSTNMFYLRNEYYTKIPKKINGKRKKCTFKNVPWTEHHAGFWCKTGKSISERNMITSKATQNYIVV